MGLGMDMGGMSYWKTVQRSSLEKSAGLLPA